MDADAALLKSSIVEDVPVQRHVRLDAFDHDFVQGAVQAAQKIWADSALFAVEVDRSVVYAAFHVKGEFVNFWGSPVEKAPGPAS